LSRLTEDCNTENSMSYLEDRVSIIAPVFNTSKYLEEFIQSIIGQSYKNWELLLIDDGSTDNSASICKRYAQKDSRISLMRRPESREKGAQTCRNIGLENAKGYYVIFYDSDDIIADYALEQRVRYMQQNPDLDFAVFPLLGFRDSINNGFELLLGHGKKPTLDEFVGYAPPPFVVVTNIYKRSSLIDNNLLWDVNLKSLQDSHYNITAITAGLKFEYSNAKPDYFYRLSSTNSISKKLSSKEHQQSRLYYYNDIIRKTDGLITNSSKKFFANFIIREYVFNRKSAILREYLYYTNIPISSTNKFKIRIISKLGNARIKKYLYIILCPLFEGLYRVRMRNYYKRIIFNQHKLR